MNRRTFIINISAVTALGLLNRCNISSNKKSENVISDVLEKNSRFISNGNFNIKLDMKTGSFLLELKKDEKKVFYSVVSGFEMLDGEKITSTEFSNHHISKKHVSNCWGNGTVFQFSHSGGNNNCTLNQYFTFFNNRSFFHLRTEVINDSSKILELKNIKVLDNGKVLHDTLLNSSHNNLWMFRNGSERPSDPHCFVKIDFNQPIEEIKKENNEWEIGRWLKKDGNNKHFLSEMLVLLKNLEYDELLLLGFVSQADYGCRHWIGSGENMSISSESCLANYKLMPGEKVFSETLQVNSGSNRLELIDTFISSVTANMKPIVLDKALTGWSSWQYYGRDISEHDVLENVKYLSVKNIPVEYILIDDGYSITRGDWLEHNKRFPNGMKILADKIKKAGFKPGIWIAPFTAISTSKLVKEHPDWMMKNNKGEFVQKTSHLGHVYTLDFTVNGARNWLRNLIKVIVKEWGYKWIKLDGPLVTYYDGGIYANDNITPIQHIRMALEIIREEAGNNVIIEGEGYYGPAIGLVQTHRVTQDIQQKWKRLRHCCQANLMAGYMHNKFWINNPDAFILRNTPSPYRKNMWGDGLDEEIMSIEELRMVTTAFALTGGVVMLTDKMTELSVEREKIIRSFLPVYKNAAIPVDMFNGHKASQLFHLPVINGNDKWDVLGAFFWYDDVNELNLNLTDIGLNPRNNYHVFEYWSQKYLGKVNNKMTIKKTSQHSVQLFSIREDTGKPQFLSSNLHITQDAVNLKNYSYNQHDKKMTFAIDCFDQREVRLFFHVPDTLKVKKIGTEAEITNNYPEHNILMVAYSAKGSVNFVIEFELI